MLHIFMLVILLMSDMLMLDFMLLNMLNMLKMNVVNTYSITSTGNVSIQVNQSAIKLNQDLIPGSKCHTGTQY